MVNQRGLVDDGFIVKFMNDDLIALKNVTARRRAAKLGEGIEVVKQSGDAARIDLVHNQLSSLASSYNVHLANTTLDARDSGWRHRKFTHAQTKK